MFQSPIPWAWRAVALITMGTALFAIGWIKGETHAGMQALQQENAALVRANGTISKLQTEARDREHQHALNLNLISSNLQKELQDARTQHAADRAALRSGSLRLHDPGSSSSTCADPASAAGSAAGRRDGAEARQLSDTAAEFLLEFAADADDVARQLGACQQALMEDRRFQDGPNQ